MVNPKLFDQVRYAIRVRHLSYRTEQAYVHWIRKFILFHGKKHPMDMGESEVSQFLTYLAVRKRVSNAFFLYLLSKRGGIESSLDLVFR